MKFLELKNVTKDYKSEAGVFLAYYIACSIFNNVKII